MEKLIKITQPDSNLASFATKQWKPYTSNFAGVYQFCPPVYQSPLEPLTIDFKGHLLLGKSQALERWWPLPERYIQLVNRTRFKRSSCAWNPLPPVSSSFCQSVESREKRRVCCQVGNSLGSSFASSNDARRNLDRSRCNRDVFFVVRHSNTVLGCTGNSSSF